MNEVQVPCMLNLASCMKQKKQFEKGVKLCDQAILMNKTNFVAYIRRGMMYQAMKDFDNALKDFKTAKELGAEETYLDFISRATEEILTAQDKKKQAYKKFFEEGSLYQENSITEQTADQIKNQELKPSSKEEEIAGPKILYYNDDLEELNRYGFFKYVLYPAKKSYKFMKDKTACCRRRGGNYHLD